MTILQTCIESDQAMNFMAQSTRHIEEATVDLYAVAIATNAFINENLFEFIHDDDDVYDVFENIKAFSAAHMLIAFEVDEDKKKSMTQKLLKGSAAAGALAAGGAAGTIAYRSNLGGVQDAMRRVTNRMGNLNQKDKENADKLTLTQKDTVLDELSKNGASIHSIKNRPAAGWVVRQGKPGSIKEPASIKEPVSGSGHPAPASHPDEQTVEA